MTCDHAVDCALHEGAECDCNMEMVIDEPGLLAIARVGLAACAPCVDAHGFRVHMHGDPGPHTCAMIAADTGEECATCGRIVGAVDGLGHDLGGEGG